MFFITVLLFVIIALTILLFFNIKLKTKVSNREITLVVSFLNLKVVKKRYTVERDKGRIFSLFEHKKEKKIYVTSLFDIISKKSSIKKEKTKKENIINYVIRRAFLNKYVLERAFILISIKLIVGASDAVSTVYILGIIKIILGVVEGIYGSKKHVLEAELIPEFTEKRIELNISCIINLSLANIIKGYIIYKKK